MNIEYHLRPLLERILIDTQTDILYAKWNWLHARQDRIRRKNMNEVKYNENTI